MPVRPGVTIRDATRSLGSVLDGLVTVYGAAFSQPPHDEPVTAGRAWASERFPGHVARDGFGLVVAEVRDAVVGFAYGYTGAPGQWWTDTVGATLTRAERARWLDRHFEFVELAVLPDLQEQGIGGELHDALVERRTERTAALSTQDANEAALRLYRGRGWTTLRGGFRFPGSDVGWSILVRDLTR